MQLLLLLTGFTLALGAAPRASPYQDINISPLPDGGYALNVKSADDDTDGFVFGLLGRKVAADPAVTFERSIYYNDTARAWMITVTWQGPADSVFEDCFNFGDMQWYGGPEQKEQYWPVQKARLQKYSAIPKEEDNTGIFERYWLNSAGTYIYLSPESPLFVDYHNIEDNHICFIAEITAPYTTKRTNNLLKYDLWFFENAKVAHQHAVATYLDKPLGIPDYRMIQYPIWSTWARYTAKINSENLLAFANEIVDHGFPNAQFEIDDLWETCYGSLTVDEGENKLPNFAELIQEIKSLGFRVTIWMHPFINQDCQPWYNNALEAGYLVLNEDGNPNTTWWNSIGPVSSYVDFTNPEANDWWEARVKHVLETYDIDSAKFDAGESSWSPQIPVQFGLNELHPSHIVRDYVNTIAQFGPMMELRTGSRSQNLPVFIRMIDKDTYWGFNNGLATLITTLLQLNIAGYTLVLPDMIGGNGYNEAPSKELFIRWTQANVFMPAMQYSFVPWDHDQETVDICLKYTQLHADYADVIVAAMEASVRSGTPVNAPIWWMDPTDDVALATWDEYLLGENILAAPVLEEGAESRNVYLPVGTWTDGNTGEEYEGPLWIVDYPAPLDTLPYFLLA